MPQKGGCRVAGKGDGGGRTMGVLGGWIKNKAYNDQKMTFKKNKRNGYLPQVEEEPIDQRKTLSSLLRIYSDYAQEHGDLEQLSHHMSQSLV